MSNPSDTARSMNYTHSVNARHFGVVWLRVVVMALADVLSFLSAMYLFRIGREVPRLMFVRSPGDMGAAIDVFVVLGALFVAMRYISGDYSRRRLFWECTRATSIAVLVTSLPCFVILLAFPNQYSAIAEFGSWGLLFFLVPLMRQIARVGLFRLRLWGLPTALVADGSRFADVYGALRDTISLGYEVRWVATSASDDAVDIAHLPGAEMIERLDLSNPAQVTARLVGEGCDHAVIAIDNMQSPLFADLVQRLTQADIMVSFSPSFRRLPLSQITTSFFFGRDILLFQMRSSLQRIPHRLGKRLFDIVVSAWALLVLSPVFLTITLLIKLQYRGVPIVFGQKVVGLGGRTFKMWKFSTMRPDAHLALESLLAKDETLRREWAETFKLKNDPRILPGVGNFLRKTSLNEIPQLINVLLGDMSLVGPRPVKSVELVQYYGTAAHLYRRVRPGITGLWQISGRSDTSYEERVNYDAWYILNWTFWYDIVILLQTVWTVLRRKGAY